MNCNIELHDELVDSGEISCPFCDERLEDCLVKEYESCCDDRQIINDNGKNVCCSCGSVHGYDFANENIDFYENMFKIRRKSVYHRKCHIENVVTDICSKNGITISRDKIERICRVFNEIEKILPQINGKRKRMISINYILKQLFEKLGIPHDNIRITKSERTLACYQQYWGKVQLLIGDKIQSIINK